MRGFAIAGTGGFGVVLTGNIFFYFIVLGLYICLDKGYLGTSGHDGRRLFAQAQWVTNLADFFRSLSHA